MQIFVNGMEVAFTQHNETYISEVLVGFKNWLEKKIDDVQKVEVTALSKLEIEFIQYSVIKNYFSALIEAIDKKDTEALANLASQYDEIQKTLSLNVKFAQGDENKLELMLKNPTDGDNPDAIKNAALSIVKLCENGLEELKNGKN